MKLKLPSAVTQTVSRQILIGKKHSPTILFVGGVVGVVATTVTACRATLKLERVINETKENLDLARTLKHSDYSEKDRSQDISYIYVRSLVKLGKLYGPSIILGSLSIGALAGSHNILNNRNAGLTAAYTMLLNSFTDYRGRVVGELGEDKDREFRFGSETIDVVTQDKNGPKKKKVKIVGEGKYSQYARLFESTNQNWSPLPEYNVMFLRGVQNQAGDRLRAKGHLFLNDVYDDLGMDRTPDGAVTGWIWGSAGKDQFVDFGIFDDSSLSRFHDYVTGREGAIWLDFNVDGLIWNLI
jgi:hypothetical protein